MKKLDPKLIMVIVFVLILVAPIKEGYRYFMLALFPFYIAISNIVILRNLLLYNEENLKFKRMEENYGTKKAFLLFSLLLIIMPILLGGLLIVSGIRIL